MLKKTITYTDYNGTQRTEDFYFNLKKSEIMEMQLGITGGFAEMIERIMQAQDVPQIANVFKELILKSYGEKTPDGKGFIKKRNGELLAEAFEQTEAFSELFMELATNTEAASAFVNGIVPAEMNPNNQTNPVPAPKL